VRGSFCSLLPPVCLCSRGAAGSRQQAAGHDRYFHASLCSSPIKYNPCFQQLLLAMMIGLEHVARIFAKGLRFRKKQENFCWLDSKISCNQQDEESMSSSLNVASECCLCSERSYL